jgi:hypothetical protein
MSKTKKRARTKRGQKTLADLQAAGALQFNDAARYLSIHPATLRRLWERKLIRSNRALRVHLFPRAELDRFLAEGMSE